jgi:hypothetical protein
MPKRGKNDDRLKGRELVSRRLQQAGLTVAGEPGARVANWVSEAIGCGRISVPQAEPEPAPSRDYPIRIPSKPV